MAVEPDELHTTGMSIKDMLQEAVTAINAAGLTGARLDAEVLLSHCLQKDRLFLYAYPEQILTDRQINQYRELITRRVSREPVAYIIGRKEFWSLTFDVDRRVLIPRPETELLVEEALKIASGFDNVAARILDVGVGSGAISIALASELKHARLIAVDISQDAVIVARHNAEKLGLDDRIAFVVGDLLRPFSGKFDMIISNPPYIAEADFTSLAEDVRVFEPASALLAGSDGLSFHRELIWTGRERLQDGGWLLMEIGAGQKKEVETMLRASCLFSGIRFCADYAGLDRIVVTRRS